jgi:hypothetical protein
LGSDFRSKAHIFVRGNIEKGTGISVEQKPQTQLDGHEGIFSLKTAVSETSMMPYQRFLRQHWFGISASETESELS